MTWSYSASSLGLDRNKVRLMIGDTDTTRQQAQDEEIDFVLTEQTSPTLAAAATCDLLAAKYAFQANTENGVLRVSASVRMKHYMDLADRLRAGGAGSIPGDPNIIEATMYVGGSSIAAKEAIFGDSDTVQPAFKLGMDDMPGGDTTTASV